MLERLLDLLAFGGLLLGLAGVVYSFVLNRRKKTSLQLLLDNWTPEDSKDWAAPATEERGSIRKVELTPAEFEQLKEVQKRELREQALKRGSLNERCRAAGITDPVERQKFAAARMLLPALFGIPLGLVLYIAAGSAEFLGYGAGFGMVLGLYLPGAVLSRRIRARSDEIMFYLPLVIEQLQIGVSSGLSVGPCVRSVVDMAHLRSSHNIVTDLLSAALLKVKLGEGLDQALLEIGTESGHTELKHAFMGLARVFKHGGEVTREMRTLGDAVSSNRELEVIARINKLELEATGPVAMVFTGFLVIVLIGFGIQMVGGLRGR